MTITDVALDQELLAQIYDRIRKLMDSGMSKEDAVARVTDEFRAHQKIVQGAHYAFSTAILQSRLTTSEWETPATAEELRDKYLR